MAKNIHFHYCSGWLICAPRHRAWQGAGQDRAHGRVEASMRAFRLASACHCVGVAMVWPGLYACRPPYLWRWLGQGRLLSAPCVAPLVVAKAKPGLLVGSVRGRDLARNVCMQAPFVVATAWPGLAALRHLSWMGLLCSSLGASMALGVI